MLYRGGGTLQNKKGFTLIELLAVIVILAIIALIATPIVLSIISESKESSGLRSAEMYLDAVETSIATSTLNNKKIIDGTYNIMSDGNICIGTITDKLCNDELKIEIKGEAPKEGSITVSRGIIYKVELVYENVAITKNSDEELVYIKQICEEVEQVTTGTKASTRVDFETIKYKAGDEYKCKVAKDKEYTFFVLGTNSDGTINLIMDRNIYYDSETGKSGLTDDDNLGLVAYNISGDATGVGPVTAIEYLNNATKDWENLPKINSIYNDEGGNFENFLINGYARLPYKSELSNFDSINKTNLWMYNYLKNYSNVSGEGLKNIDGIGGYWTFFSLESDSSIAWCVDRQGVVLNKYTDNDKANGVRPVITISKNYIK